MFSLHKIQKPTMIVGEEALPTLEHFPGLELILQNLQHISSILVACQDLPIFLASLDLSDLPAPSQTQPFFHPPPTYLLLEIISSILKVQQQSIV